MKDIYYNKLVRDRIPTVIKNTGNDCTTEILGNEKFFLKLQEKLLEEVDEYMTSNNDIYELADIVEVIYGLVEASGKTIDEFNHIRQQKVLEKGSFKEKIFLVSVTEK